jgi:hypothetical protein
MKQISIMNRVLSLSVALGLASLIPASLHATPYASCITNSATTVGFRLNESGGTVTVTYEDGTTNSNYNGTNLVKGAYTFSLVGHTGFAIAVTKTGNGVPSQISIDNTSANNAPTNFTYFTSPRGMAVNSNPKIGSLFGRIYVANVGAPPNKGLYILNSDMSLVASNTVAGTGVFGASGTSGPWKLRVGPDNQLIVGDFSTASAALWQFSPDLSSSNVLLGPVGQVAGQNALVHGDIFGTARVSGSLANSNLVLWVADGNLPVPTLTQNPTIVLGPGTSPGMYNNVFRYDIGAGPLPWTNQPNYAFNLGLDVINGLVCESDVAPDGKVIAAFGRSNNSNPNVTVLETNGLSILWTSWVDTKGNGDPWRGDIMSSTVQYTYGGIRVSPDNQYIVSSGFQGALLIAKMTNGLPDNNTMFAITNTPNANTSRGGVDWDAANNVYQVNGNSSEMRAFSLGLTATCITSNDITGTNGTFVVIAPSAVATALATTPNATQGYGTPTNGVITISLSTNVLTAPTTVTFTKTGTAFYTTNYTLNIGTNGNGVVITPTNVVFPAGTYPGVGNWSVDVKITPTAIPLSGPTTTATFTLLGGATYTVGGSTAKATVSIINTGPQLLTLTVVTNSTTMSRAVTNDYVMFRITRFGDTTVPAYTITNINYSGTAVFPVDYTARAQRFSGSLLADGSPGIVIYPGEVFITNAIGNPLMRANLNVPATNVTIVLSLTNALTGTNVTSLEGYSYITDTNGITLTELDNAYANAVVLWSNPLTNSVDSTNWTLTYASQSLGTNTALPVVIPNYTNNQGSLSAGGTNDFDVQFGYPLPDGIPASPAMIANGWTNVLKMTINKNQGSPAGVNLYPQGQKFAGNYALKFSMYLSLWSVAIGNNYAGVIPREYATFGINHNGTNCNWRPSRNPPANTSGTTNSDGIWFAIDAADNAATPADFDAFTPPGLPNAGVTADFVSNAGSAMRGIFKNPPFVNTQNPLGGNPVNQWVDVSVEITKQTNCTIYINGAPVLNSFSIGSTNTTTRNALPSTTGAVMLGYLDPDASIGDAASQYVLYSNIRAVELSPYITSYPLSLIVTQGANVSFTSSASFATAPLTNTWTLGNTALTPVANLQIDSANATNLTSTLSLSNVQVGTNYLAVFSDLAGSVTSVVARLEVIIGPTNRTVNVGSNFVQFAVIPSGPAAPTAYQWRTNGVALVNSTHFAGVTNSTLTISNVLLSDAVVYTCSVTNANGSVAPSATLTVVAPQPTFSTIALVGTNAVLQFTTANAFDNTNSFTLQRSVTVQGPYSNTVGTVSGGPGAFQVTVPRTTNDTMFYRLIHN